MLLLIALWGAAWAETPRLPDHVRPTSLSVALDVDPSTDSVTGLATLGLDVKVKTREVTLHAEELILGDAAFVSRKGKRVAATVTPLDGGRVTLTAASNLAPGAWSVEIPYEAPIHEQPYGLYRFEHQGEPYLVTQLEADDARTVWPCFDEPGLKVPHQLTITTPDGLTVITNAPAVEVTSTGGWTTHVFAQTPPIPTYAGALAVGPYEAVVVDGVGVPASIVVPKGQGENVGLLVDLLPTVVRAAEAWFGSPYPYAKLDVVVVPEFAFGAMENPGAIVMNGRLIPEPDRVTPRARYGLAMVTAHEVAHMWFGNVVTMAWWDDFWLNESFAMWMGDRLARELLPDLRRHLEAPASLAGMLRYDGSATARPMRTEIDPAAIFETANFAVYDKGQALLDQVESWIGPAAFQRGVRDYLERHALGNATSSDLFAALEAASGAPVGEVLAPFLDRPGAPEITVRVDGDTVYLSQRRYARLGATFADDGAHWPVIVRLRVGRPDGSSEIVTHRLDGAEATLDIGPWAWVFPAADGRGYYAWRLDGAARDALLDHVDALSDVEKVAIFTQASLEVATGDRAPASLLPLIPRFAGETDPAVLSEVIGLAGYVRVVEDLDPADPTAVASARAWMRETMRPLLDGVGFEPTPGEGADRAEARQQLLGLLAWAEDPEVIAYATRLAEANLADPRAGDPALTPWALWVHAERAPASHQQTLLDKAAATDLPMLRSRYLSLAGVVRGEAPRARALALALEHDRAMDDTFSLLGGVYRQADHDATLQDALLTWKMAHHDALAAKLPPQYRPYLASVSGCRVALLDTARAFYLDPARAVTGTERTLKESEERVRQCIADRDARAPSIVAFLATWREAQPEGPGKPR